MSINCQFINTETGENSDRIVNLPEPSCLAEEIDEKESDDTGRAGSRTADADKTGSGSGCDERRSGAVTDGVSFTCYHIPATDDDSHQIAQTETDVTCRQEDQRSLWIPINERERTNG